MFINALVFINSSVVYKLWGGEGRGGGGGGKGSWNISSRVPTPPPPPPPPSPLPPPRLRYGIYDLRMSCVTVTVLCGFSFSSNGSQITKVPVHQPNLQHVITHIGTCSSWYIPRDYNIYTPSPFLLAMRSLTLEKILKNTANTAEFAVSA